MKRGMLSLSRDAAERAKRVNYPSNAPKGTAQSESARSAAAPEKRESEAQNILGQNQPRIQVQNKPQQQAAQSAAKPPVSQPAPAPATPARQYASGFLKEALRSHDRIVERIKNAEPPPPERCILSPVQTTEREETAQKHVPQTHHEEEEREDMPIL